MFSGLYSPTHIFIFVLVSLGSNSASVIHMRHAGLFVYMFGLSFIEEDGSLALVLSFLAAFWVYAFTYSHA